MKQLFFVVGMLTLSAAGFAQQKTGNETVPATMVKDSVVLQNRLIKLESEIVGLKASHAELKKQLDELRTGNSKGKKPVVSRVGSKQVNWIAE